MTTTLDFALKENFEIVAGDRWNVLTVLIVHTNRRNRCWPSSKTIARLATNGNPNRAVEARKWLLSHGAMVLVPYEKRFGEDETGLPKRQFIYELTGKIYTCDNPECCKKAGITITYLHLNPSSTKETKDSEVMAHDNFNAPEVIASHNYDSHNQSNSISQGVESSPKGEDTTPKTERKERPRNLWFDALVQAFGIPYDKLTKSVKKTYGNAAAELKEINFPVERIPEIYRWCELQKWTNFTPMALAKHAPSWLKNNPPKSPNGYVPVNQRTSAMDFVRMVNP